MVESTQQRARVEANEASGDDPSRVASVTGGAHSIAPAEWGSAPGAQGTAWAEHATAQQWNVEDYNGWPGHDPSDDKVWNPLMQSARDLEESRQRNARRFEESLRRWRSTPY